MANHRETLNERYLVRSRHQTPEMVICPSFSGWYTLDDKMKDDGLEDSDFAIRNENGRPVMHWQDNNSIYVDHNP